MVTACSALSDGNVTPCLMACSPLISVFMGTLWLLSVCATRYCNHITVTSTLLLALQKFFSYQHGRQKKLKTKSFYSHGNQLMEENGGVVRITRRVLGKNQKHLHYAANICTNKESRVMLKPSVCRLQPGSQSRWRLMFYHRGFGLVFISVLVCVRL